jgi:hypothetical protein
LKSLAHPEWPYSGTPWEWRGVAKKAQDQAEARFYETVCSKPWGSFRAVHDGTPIFDETIYQKQNFGPELK